MTAGKNGSTITIQNQKNLFIALLFIKVDKIGAGDSFMAIFSVMNKCFGNNYLFLSSLATTQVLEGYGNENSIQLANLLKATKYILK